MRSPRASARHKTLAAIAASLLLALSLLPQPSSAQPGRVTGTVVSIADGDSMIVELSDGAQERVRLTGIDAPETKHPSKPVQCFGPEATARLSELVLGTSVALELDVQERDRFGRLLAYVWPDGSTQMLNEQLAAEGYALPLTIAPNVRYAERFQRAAATARDNNLGLWAGCSTEGVPTEATDYEGTTEDREVVAAAPTPAPTPAPDFGSRCSEIIASTPDRGGPTRDQQWGICTQLGEKHGAAGVDCYAQATQKTAVLIGRISTQTHNDLFNAELTVCTAAIR